jgi:hypothetical protein
MARRILVVFAIVVASMGAAALVPSCVHRFECAAKEPVYDNGGLDGAGPSTPALFADCP